MTVHKGKKRSIINYLYISTFKNLPSVVLSHVKCFGICSLIYFCMALASVKRKKKGRKEKKHICSLGQMVIFYFVEVENQENWF